MGFTTIFAIIVLCMIVMAVGVVYFLYRAEQARKNPTKVETAIDNIADSAATISAVADDIALIQNRNESLARQKMVLDQIDSVHNLGLQGLVGVLFKNAKFVYGYAKGFYSDELLNKLEASLVLNTPGMRYYELTDKARKVSYVICLNEITLKPRGTVIKKLDGTEVENYYRVSYAIPITPNCGDVCLVELSKEFHDMLQESKVTTSVAPGSIARYYFDQFGELTQRPSAVSHSQITDYTFQKPLKHDGTRMNPTNFISKAVEALQKGFHLVVCGDIGTGKSTVITGILGSTPDDVAIVSLSSQSFKLLMGSDNLFYDTVEKFSKKGQKVIFTMDEAQELDPDDIGLLLTKMDSFNTAAGAAFLLSVQGTIDSVKKKYPALVRPGRSTLYEIPKFGAEEAEAMINHIAGKTEYVKKDKNFKVKGPMTLAEIWGLFSPKENQNPL